jgi:hypothetical protein
VKGSVVDVSSVTSGVVVSPSVVVAAADVLEVLVSAAEDVVAAADVDEVLVSAADVVVTAAVVACSVVDGVSGVPGVVVAGGPFVLATVVLG